MAFLDEKGLARFWESARPSRVRGMTRAEFDALPEEDRRGLIVVRDAAGSASPGGGAVSKEDENHERIVGYTKEDKPIYERRYYNAKMVTDYNTTADYDVSDWSIDELLSLSGHMVNPSSSGIGQLPVYAYRVSDGAFNMFELFFVNNNIRLQNISNAKATSTWFGSDTVITITFTKTTD